MRLTPLERLFARHSLGKVHTVEPLPGGQLNAAVRVNEVYVVRWREAGKSTGSLKREFALLGRLQGKIPVPEPVASGMDDVLGEYVIETWLPGRSLLDAWLSNPDVATREWWVLQWAAAIEALHGERFPRPGDLPEGQLREAPSWRSYVEGRIRKRLDELMRIPAMDRELVFAAERYLKRYAPVLADGPFCLIHRDLHFANTLVDGPQLSALLDWELAEVGPPDYELDTIYRFLRYPWLFARPEVADRVSPSRFASVWIRMKRGYPALFQVPNLRERLSLYALDHCLSCLCQGYGGRWGNEAAIEITLRRLAEILQNRYGPD